MLYDNQSKIKEQQEEYQLQEEEYEDNLRQKEEIERRNEIHVDIIESLFHYAEQNKTSFTFSEWFQSLEDKKEDYIKDKIIFLVMLKLFEVETISISEFLKEEAVNETCNGEFDLSYCLYKIVKEKRRSFSFDGIRIEKTDHVFRYEIREEEKETQEEIEMSEVRIVVIGRNEIKNGRSLEDL